MIAFSVAPLKKLSPQSVLLIVCTDISERNEQRTDEDRDTILESNRTQRNDTLQVVVVDIDITEGGTKISLAAMTEGDLSFRPGADGDNGLDAHREGVANDSL